MPGPIFDFAHVRAAIDAVERLDSVAALAVSRLPATGHLLRHQDRFGLRPPSAAEALTRELLFPLEETRRLVPDVRRVLGEAEAAAGAMAGTAGEAAAGTTEASAARRETPTWLEVVLSLLPGGSARSGGRYGGAARPAGRSEPLDGAVLYLTFGYDIGVVFGPGSCSVNLAHRLLRASPDWFPVYAAHELHHVGYLRFQRVPRVREVTSSRRLAGPARGMGEDEVGAALEAFSSPDKLLHLVGCRPAQRIERERGRETLIETVLTGPRRFFELARPAGNAPDWEDEGGGR